MASLARDNNGKKRIQFIADGRRKTIRLGKVSLRQAEAVRRHVEALIAATKTGVVAEETVGWLGSLDDRMYGKLVHVGLVQPRQNARLGTILDEYITSRFVDAKGSTLTVYGHTRRNLVEFFGKAKPLQSITSGDADCWRQWLLEQGLSDNTVRRRCALAKQFFKAAIRRGLIGENPFDDLPVAIRSNFDRFYFVSREEIEKVLAACPDAQWRLIVALCRYGGLRCPSEVLSLRWGDVHWQQQRLTVHSPKTEHHEGGESRIIPLFPEIQPYLYEAFEQAEPGAEFLITRYQLPTNNNLRTQFLRIIRKAGLKPWAKPFQNLRVSRQIELCEDFPEHVVCQWIGNSRLVARKHYLQVTDAHFERAVRGSFLQAAQNAAQQMSEMLRNTSNPIREPAKFDGNQRISIQCEAKVGDAGFEPATG